MLQLFTDLIVWKKSHLFVLDIYKITNLFPKEERYCLTNQLRRAAVSITSNIAEGFYRKSQFDKIQFYNYSLASNAEIQNQLIIAKDLKYISYDIFEKLSINSLEIRKLINSLIRSTSLKD